MYLDAHDGTSIYYETAGSGAPILLLHGFSNDHRMWIDTGWANRLAKHFTVILTDFRGCGRSDKPENVDAYTTEAHCRDIENVLEACRVGAPVVWGWSLGATIALHYSKRKNVRGTIAAGTYFGAIFTKEYIDARLAEADTETNKIRWMALRSWPGISPQEIHSPFLLYTGSNDGNVVINARKQAGEIAAAGGLLKIIDGANHYGLVSDMQSTERIVMSFIEETMRRARDEKT